MSASAPIIGVGLAQHERPRHHRGIRTGLAAVLAGIAVAAPASVTPPVQPGAPAGPHIPRRAVLQARARGLGIVVVNLGPAAAVEVVLVGPPSLAVRGRACTRTAVLRCRLGTLAPHSRARVGLRHAGAGRVRVSAANAAVVVLRL